MALTHGVFYLNIFFLLLFHVLLRQKIVCRLPEERHKLIIYML